MSQSSKPCVVGLGKLGLPLAGVLASVGFQTTGVDLNENLVSEIKSGNFRSPEPELETLLSQFASKLNFTSRFDDTTDSNIFFLIVPTPSQSDGSFDNSSIVSAIEKLLVSWREAKQDKTIVIVSTVMPGSCQTVFVPMIREWEKQHQNSIRISLLYSPEFIALGTVVHNLRNPDMTLIGSENPSEAREFLAIMDAVTSGKPQTQILNLTEAEIVKLMVNCFVTMKISFANFIGELTGLFPATDKHKVAQALGMDTRIGGKYLRPGFGFAGPCFPRDNKALIALSNSFGLKPSLGLATDEINDRQPDQADAAGVCAQSALRRPQLRTMLPAAPPYRAPHRTQPARAPPLVLEISPSVGDEGHSLFVRRSSTSRGGRASFVSAPSASSCSSARRSRG